MRILLILAIEPGGEAGPAPEFDGLLEAYYLFCDAGLELVVASPSGGSAWAASDRANASADLARRFRADPQARDTLNDLLRLEDVHAEDFVAAFCLGFGRFDWSGLAEDRAGALIWDLLMLGRAVAVISPGDAHPISGPGKGLLIIGRTPQTPGLAARALLGAIGRWG
ncbi:MAG: hypothetical protein WDM85_09265 [Caulobacteraceae bacterium]